MVHSFTRLELAQANGQLFTQAALALLSINNLRIAYIYRRNTTAHIAVFLGIICTIITQAASLAAFLTQDATGCGPSVYVVTALRHIAVIVAAFVILFVSRRMLKHEAVLQRWRQSIWLVGSLLLIIIGVASIWELAALSISVNVFGACYGVFNPVLTIVRVVHTWLLNIFLATVLMRLLWAWLMEERAIGKELEVDPHFIIPFLTAVRREGVTALFALSLISCLPPAFLIHNLDRESNGYYIGIQCTLLSGFLAFYLRGRWLNREEYPSIGPAAVAASSPIPEVVISDTAVLPVENNETLEEIPLEEDVGAADEETGDAMSISTTSSSFPSISTYEPSPPIPFPHR